MNTVQELFIHELQVIHSAERRLLDVLGEAERQSQRGELKRAFGQHRKQTLKHVQRLEKIFRSLGEEAEEQNCEGLEGLLREQQTNERQGLSPELADLDRAASGIKIENYECATYQNLILLAQKMGHRDAVGWMRETVAEEKEAAQLLSELLKASKLDWKAGMETPHRRAA